MPVIKGTGLPVGHPFNPGPGKAVIIPGPRNSARAEQPPAQASTEPSNSPDDPMQTGIDANEASLRKMFAEHGTASQSNSEPSTSAESSPEPTTADDERLLSDDELHRLAVEKGMQSSEFMQAADAKMMNSLAKLRKNASKPSTSASLPAESTEENRQSSKLI